MFEMNETANAIQRRMYHLLITPVNKKEEIPARASTQDLLLK